MTWNATPSCLHVWIVRTYILVEGWVMLFDFDFSLLSCVCDWESGWRAEVLRLGELD